MDPRLPTRAPATRRLAVAAVVLLLLATACGGARAGDDGGGRLLVSGSATLAPLLAQVANRYDERGGSVQVDVQTGGSAAGVNNLAQGTTDIAMVTARLYEDVDGVEPHVIGRDGVAPIVHTDSPVRVDGFTREELVTIFTGGPDRGPWPGLAEGESYVVVGKAAGRGTLQVFAEYLGIEPEDQVADVEIGDNAQGIQVVAQERTAIAYISIGVVELAIAEGTPVRLLGVDGVPADVELVADGSFPISRNLELVTRTDPDPAALEFIEYVRSPEHEDLFRRFGFVRASS